MNTPWTAPRTVVAQPFDFTFEPDRTALVMIDMQRDFIEPGGFGESLGNDVSQLARVVGPARELLDWARKRGLLVVHTRARVIPGSDSLWAFEQALKSGHVGGVLAWLPARLRADRLRRALHSGLGWNVTLVLVGASAAAAAHCPRRSPAARSGCYALTT